MKTSSVSDELRKRILDVAWAAIVEAGRSDVSLAAIARQAGVSRQTLYLAFGDRTGLLFAMARNADASSEHARRMREIADGDGDDHHTLHAFIDAWIAHLPEIYPVGILLGAAAATDAEARDVFDDRMVQSLLYSFECITGRMELNGQLRAGWDAVRTAELAWSLTHIDVWKNLVVGRGWTPGQFRAAAIAALNQALLQS